MTLDDITRAAVIAACDEFDSLGRDRFLHDAGFGRAKSYYLELRGKLYDSKAIVGYAHGISGDRAWRAADFSGGEKTVADRLRELGFAVRFMRNPNWTWDEIVLACALVQSNGWRAVSQERHEAIRLSDLLQSTAIHPIDGRASDFRNPAGVERKTGDLVSCLPGRRRTNGNRLDIEVVDAFRSRPEAMTREAQAIEIALKDWHDRSDALTDPDIPDDGVDEGRVLLRRHLARERNTTLKRRKLAAIARGGQAIACEVCGFDFLSTYGARGADYIECHHRTPLHVSGPTLTRIQDLALICSNCHRMIHRTAPWLSVEELTDIIHARQQVKD